MVTPPAERVGAHQNGRGHGQGGVWTKAPKPGGMEAGLPHPIRAQGHGHIQIHVHVHGHPCEGVQKARISPCLCPPGLSVMLGICSV